MRSSEEQLMNAVGCGLLKFRKVEDDFLCEYANLEAERIFGVAEGILWSKLIAGFKLNRPLPDEYLKLPNGKVYQVLKKELEDHTYLFTLLDKTCETQVDQEIGEFLHIASHDLQEPLRKIISFGERIERNKQYLGEENSLYLSRMMNATDRMQHLLSGLLSFSQLGISNEPFTEFDLTEAAKLAYQEALESAGRPHVQFEIEELPKIQARKTQIIRLLQELFANAIKFQDDDHRPELKVVGVVDDSDNKVELTIIDNGIGFENEHSERIFKLFSRLNGRAEYEGAGIGLAICKKIVDAHSGTIHADSLPGEGTKITLVLPLRQSSLSS